MSWHWEQNPKDAPIPEVPSHRAHKDRRRWCKGKVGREHVVDQLVRIYDMPCREYHRWRHPHGEQLSQVHWRCMHYRACSVCGKHMEALPASDCPDRPATLPAPRRHPNASRGVG